jgi:hypothetical protein
MTQVASFLAPALEPKFLVLHTFVLSAVAIHFRGRVRRRFFAIKYLTLGGLLTAFIVWA